MPDALIEPPQEPKQGPMPKRPLHEPPAGSNPPSGPAQLFVAFTLLALQGFGGVLAVAHRELVERRRWMSNEAYLQEVALSQALPGPNVCNLAVMYGDRCFGWRGAAAALAGLMTVPACLLLAAVVAYTHWSGHAMVEGALHGMGAVAAGTVAGTALKLIGELRRHPLGAAAGFAWRPSPLGHWPCCGGPLPRSFWAWAAWGCRSPGGAWRVTTAVKGASHELGPSLGLVGL